MLESNYIYVLVGVVCVILFPLGKKKVYFCNANKVKCFKLCAVWIPNDL